VVRLRGSVVRFAVENGSPWGSLTVAHDHCEMRTGYGRRYPFARNETTHVVAQRLRFRFLGRGSISFVGTGGVQTRRRFLPIRYNKAKHTLQEFGWPVVDTAWLPTDAP